MSTLKQQLSVWFFRFFDEQIHFFQYTIQDLYQISLKLKPNCPYTKVWHYCFYFYSAVHMFRYSFNAVFLHCKPTADAILRQYDVFYCLQNSANKFVSFNKYFYICVFGLTCSAAYVHYRLHSVPDKFIWSLMYELVHLNSFKFWSRNAELRPAWRAPIVSWNKLWHCRNARFGKPLKHLLFTPTYIRVRLILLVEFFVQLLLKVIPILFEPQFFIEFVKFSIRVCQTDFNFPQKLSGIYEFYTILWNSWITFKVYSLILSSVVIIGFVHVQLLSNLNVLLAKLRRHPRIPSYLMIIYLEFFRREHTRIVVQLLRFNANLVSPSLFAFLLSNLPLNMYLFAIGLTRQISFGIRYLLILSVIAQIICFTLASIPFGKVYISINSSETYLFYLQQKLILSQESHSSVIREKIKLMNYYELLNMKHERIAFIAGPIGSITRESMFKVWENF